MAGTGARRTTPVDADSGSWMVRILGDLELVENAKVAPTLTMLAPVLCNRATDRRRLRRWRLCEWRGGRVRPGPGRSALWRGGQRTRQPLVHLVTALQHRVQR